MWPPCPLANFPLDMQPYYSYNTVRNCISQIVHFWGVMPLVTFENFAAEDGLPIYLQIIRYVKRGVAAGSIADGEELPSRRVLSAQLGVNPNTVQKAYRTLEEEGVIASRSGAKSEVTLTPETVEAVRRQLLEQEAGSLVRALRQAGLDKAAALALLERLWDETEKEEGT